MSNEHGDALDVAVVGVAFRGPGAQDIRELWRNLCDEVESVSFFPPEQSEASSVVSGHPSYVGAWGVLEGLDTFDASFFKMSAAEAETTEPQRRVLLEAVWHALEDAGYPRGAHSGGVSVYAGGRFHEYLQLIPHGWHAPVDGFSALVGSAIDYLATFVAYKLDLRGEAVTVQTACSTGLVAIHQARQSLLVGQSDLAIAAGVCGYERQRLGYVHEEGMILSIDGHTRTFDARASGTVFGSGVGVVVLKRAADAIRDHDHIYGIVKGSAINNDGARKVGYTAPSVDGQRDVILRALENADVQPDTIGMVEAHGTGTKLGDPIEVAALHQAFSSRTSRKGFCSIGSVKSNLGHLGEAAGIAGFLKALLSTYHGVIPRTLHFESPNPGISFDQTAFRVARDVEEWSAASHPRRAGVSSFGIGGTNAHVIVEQPPRRTRPAARGKPARLATLSAATPTALAALRERMRRALVASSSTSLADVLVTLNTGRAQLPVRWASTVHAMSDLVEVLGHAEGRLGAGDDDVDASMGRRFLRGGDVDLRSLHADCDGLRIPLPGYPFERTRHWPAQGADSSSDSAPVLVQVRGESVDEVRRAARRWARVVRGARSIADVAARAQVGSAGAAHADVLAQDADELARKLDDVGRGMARATTAGGERLVFVLSGMGSQWLGMGRAVWSLGGAARAALEECAQVVMQTTGVPFADRLWREPGKELLERVDLVQPAIVATQIALIAHWRAWGVTPHSVVGHSLGEMSAAYAAGVVDLPEAMRLICRRSQVLRRFAPRGGMGLLGVAAKELALPPGVTVAEEAGAESTLVTGDRAAIEQLVAELAARGKFARSVAISYAPHGPHMEGLRDQLRAAFGDVKTVRAHTVMVSSVTGLPVDGEELGTEYWVENLVRPIRFRTASELLLRLGHSTFVELSPHPVLLATVEELARGAKRLCEVMPSLRRDEPAMSTLMNSARALAELGTRVEPYHELAAELFVSSASDAADGAAVGARESTVDAVARLVAECLRADVEKLERGANLMSLGVDSLTALRLLRRLQADLDVDLQMGALLEAGTIDGLAAKIEAVRGGGSSSTSSKGAPWTMLRAGSGPGHVLFVPGAGGTALQLLAWSSAEVTAGMSAWSVDMLDSHARVARTLPEIVEPLVAGAAELRGPFVVVGYSLGAVVAAELAKRLRAAQHYVALVLTHSLPPHRHAEQRRSGRSEFVTRWTEVHRASGIGHLDAPTYVEAIRRYHHAVERHVIEGTLEVPAEILSSPEDVIAVPHEQIREWDHVLQRATYGDLRGPHEAVAEPSNVATVRAAIERVRRALQSSPGVDGGVPGA
jgi:acyl transferase domain-containing protein/surfactin synthase thioesterase subunit/aryl carrier-like protein